MFAISIDVDWAIQPLIDDVSKILDNFKIHGTFFLTNKINYSNLSNHELAIHPNFEGSTNFEAILEKTLRILPTNNCKGSRSHKLYYNSSLPQIYQKFGLEYDSNYILPNYEKPIPFFIPHSKILEIPFFFGDDALLTNNSNFNLNKIDLHDNGVKVFMFHPIHIFLNSNSIHSYQNIKNNYDNFEYLNSQKNSKEGIRSFFIELLEFIEKNNIKTQTMNEVNKIWRKKLEK